MTTIPTATRDAAALFTSAEFPCLWLDAGFLVTTCRTQLFVTRVDYAGPPVALPLGIGEQLTFMDGVVMSEAGLHVPLDIKIPPWRRPYQLAQTGVDGTYDLELLEPILRANALLGGGKIGMHILDKAVARCSIGKGAAHVIWSPMGWGEVEVWDVN